MLVLSRGAGERVFLGSGADQITVTVIRFKHGKVRLGFDAPMDMPIRRDDAKSGPAEPPAPAGPAT